MTIERVTSPGGIEAWLVEDHTLPVVTIRFAFPGGAALDPPGKGGLAAMAASLLDEGAGPYDTAAFKTRLEDLAADLRFDAGRDEFGGSLRSLEDESFRGGGSAARALASPRFEPARDRADPRRVRCLALPAGAQPARALRPAVDARRLRGSSLWGERQRHGGTASPRLPERIWSASPASGCVAPGWSSARSATLPETSSRG